MKRLYTILMLGITLYGHAAGAEERLQLDKTTILGNRELPKVTFVVPWADAAADIPAWQLAPTVRPAAAPLDDELYRRQVEYLKQIDGGKNEDKAR